MPHSLKRKKREGKRDAILVKKEENSKQIRKEERKRKGQSKGQIKEILFTLGIFVNLLFPKFKQAILLRGERASSSVSLFLIRLQETSNMVRAGERREGEGKKRRIVKLKKK